MRLLPALAAGLAAASLAACRPDAPPAPAPAPVDAAYTFTRTDLPGLRAALDASPARLRVVNLWATWCVPCRREFPDLVRAAAAFDTLDVALAFASVDFAEMEDSVRAFQTRYGVRGHTYLVQLPENPALTLAFEPLWAGELPSTFVYDRSGARVFAHRGPVTEQMLVDTLRALLRPTS